MAERTTRAAGAGTAAGGAQAKAREATEQAKDKATEAVDQAREQAGQAVGQARGQVRQQVDARSTQAGEQVTGTAGDLRSVAEELRKQGKDAPARVADQVAERAERFGGYLRESDSDRFLNDVEDFGRRQPWAIAAGGLALGFLASRFLKASSQRRYESSSSEGTGDGARLGYGSSASGGVSPAVPAAPPGQTVERSTYNNPAL